MKLRFAETIAIADHVVDLGPGAGGAGGTICFEGTVEGLERSDTVTGRHLHDRAALKPTVRDATGALEIRGASANNLRDVDDVPEEVRKDLEIIHAADMRDVLHAALEPIEPMLEGSGSGEGRTLEA